MIPPLPDRDHGGKKKSPSKEGDRFRGVLCEYY